MFIFQQLVILRVVATNISVAALKSNAKNIEVEKYIQPLYTEIITGHVNSLGAVWRHFYIIYPHGAQSASGELIWNLVKVSLGWRIYPRSARETFLGIFRGKIRSPVKNQQSVNCLVHRTRCPVTTGRQDPMSCDAGRQDPMSCDAGRHDPMSCDTGRQDPMSCDAGRQGPMSCGAGRQDPMSCDA